MIYIRWIFGTALLLSTSLTASALELSEELVTTTPVVAEGVLYVASYGQASHRGHLRAIDIFEPLPVFLWDAADRMPFAGSHTRSSRQASAQTTRGASF